VRATLAPLETASPPAAAIKAAPTATAAPNGATIPKSASTPAKPEKQRTAKALRARKVGDEAPRLDVRLKDSRSRKIRSIAKASRKAQASGGTKRIKGPSPRKGLAKAPARRIGPKLEVGRQITSAKAVTRIVGVRQRSLRILPNAEA
jgi:hypothetical protein